MSVFAYTGLPGSGKSHTVVEHQILPALKAGRRVVTNVALKWDAVREAFPSGELVELPLDAVRSSPERIYEYVTPGSVLVLDEVWRIFPSGLQAKQVPEPFRKLLAEHRHMVNVAGESCQIVLVTQDLAQVSAFARQLVEQTFRTVKLSAVGLSKQYRLDVYMGPASGPNPPSSTRIREIFGRYHEGVWRYYESHTMSERGTSGADEKAMDRRGNVLKGPLVILGVVGVAVGLFFGVPLVKKVAAKDNGLLGRGHVTARSEPSHAVPEATAGEAPKVRTVTSFAGSGTAAGPPWRIVGVVLNHERPELSRVMVTDGQRTEVMPFKGVCYSTPTGAVRCNHRGVEIGEQGNWTRPGSGALSRS
jgi:zona occludens toxin